MNIKRFPSKASTDTYQLKSNSYSPKSLTNHMKGDEQGWQ